MSTRTYKCRNYKARLAKNQRIQLRQSRKQKLHNSTEDLREEEEYIDGAEPLEEVECPICYELCQPFDLVCGHYYCGLCLKKYLEEALAAGKTLNITCPHPSCQLQLADEIVRQVLPYDRYRLLQKQCYAANLQAAAPCCWCPNPTCETPVVAEKTDGGYPRVLCPTCKRYFCFDCATKWHEGQSCEDNQKTLEQDKRNDEALQSLIQANDLKKCNRCGIVLERTEGCVYMTCRCGYKFCWICGAEPTDGYTPTCNCMMGHVYRPVLQQEYDNPQPAASDMVWRDMPTSDAVLPPVRSNSKSKKGCLLM